jgi:hypothetical protein
MGEIRNEAERGRRDEFLFSRFIGFIVGFKQLDAIGYGSIG